MFRFFITVVMVVSMLSGKSTIARDIELEDMDDAIYHLEKQQREYNKLVKKLNKTVEQCESLRAEAVSRVSKHLQKKVSEKAGELERQNKKVDSLNIEISRLKNESQDYSKFLDVALEYYVEEADRQYASNNYMKALENYSVFEKLVTIYQFKSSKLRDEQDLKAAFVSARKIITLNDYFSSLKGKKLPIKNDIKKGVELLVGALENKSFQERVLDSVDRARKNNTSLDEIAFVTKGAEYLKIHGTVTEELRLFIAKIKL